MVDLPSLGIPGPIFSPPTPNSFFTASSNNFTQGNTTNSVSVSTTSLVRILQITAQAGYITHTSGTGLMVITLKAGTRTLGTWSTETNLIAPASDHRIVDYQGNVDFAVNASENIALECTVSGLPGGDTVTYSLAVSASGIYV